MMRKGSHTVYDIEYHRVWIAKYRYKILKGNIGYRAREIIRQVCERNGVTIVKGNVRYDHVHILISCPPTMSPAKIVQLIKGRSLKLLQGEFPELKKKYWGQNMWAVGYFCRTVGTVTEDIIKAYVDNQEDKTLDEIFKVQL